MPFRFLVSLLLAATLIISISVSAQEENCAAAHFVIEDPTQEQASVDLGDVIVRQGQLPSEGPAPIDVIDCDGDGLLDVFIPWTNSPQNQLARIEMSPDICLGEDPEQIEIFLVAPNGVTLHGRDIFGQVVDTATATADPGLQTLTLTSPLGLGAIDIEGVSICITLICWTCDLPDPDATPTPTPTPDPNIAGCVIADDFISEPTTDLTSFDMGPVLVIGGLDAVEEIIPFSISDCLGTGRLSIFVPSSVASDLSLARIFFDPKLLCDGQSPLHVEITLSHMEYCVLHAFNDQGVKVDVEVAAPHSGAQTLALTSPTGIQRVEIEGIGVCIGDICWRCGGPPPPPTPLPPPGDSGCADPDDFYPVDVFGLNEVSLGHVTITVPSGTPTPLNVIDCFGDGSRDVLVPAIIQKGLNPSAIINFSPLVCPLTAGPFTVEVTLRTSGPVTLRGFDDIGPTQVASAIAASVTETQTLVLNVNPMSVVGMRNIEIEGTGICIEEICWACGDTVPTPTPTPLPGSEGCVAVETFFDNEEQGLPQIVLGPFQISQAVMEDGTEVPLDVTDCSGDSRLDVFIPWSGNAFNTPASIQIDPALCMGNPPEFISVTLETGAFGVLHGLNAAGDEVATVTITNQAKAQTSILSSTEGVRTILIEGAEICISDLCWRCIAPVLPTPTPTIPFFPNSDCVSPDEVFMAPANDLAVVSLGAATLTAAVMPGGATSPLSVDDCSGDGMLDVLIPWSGVSAATPATIKFASDVICNGFAPAIAEITLVCGSQCVLHGLDASGMEVVTVTTTLQAAPQTLVLAHPSGILSIQFEGADICVQKICWTCEKPPPASTPTPTPTPTSTLARIPDDCVVADAFFGGPEFDLPEVDLEPVRFTMAIMGDGTAVPLEVKDCLGDSRLSVFIPWSEASASQNAAIEFETLICDGASPHWVRVRLAHFNAATLTAMDDSGAVVDTVMATPDGNPQNLILASPMGIRRIEVEGAEICVLEVCWKCVIPEFVPSVTPTPTVTNTPTPTVTDTLTPTATPTPTPTSMPTTTPTFTATPTATETVTPTPQATPTPTFNFNFVPGNFINAADLMKLLEMFRSGEIDRDALFAFLLQWLNELNLKEGAGQ